MPSGIVHRYLAGVDVWRNLFDRLTRLGRRSRSVGEQSVADYQRRIAALRAAAAGHPPTAPGQP
jgi:hypothetical protein